MIDSASPILNSQLVGALEYWFRDSVSAPWGGPFNGQIARQLMFREMHHYFKFAGGVETGTYRGTTTAFISRQISGPVFTAEVVPRYYRYSSLRLRNQSNVQLVNTDSRSLLKGLAEADKVRDQLEFFYLDAHWWKDLPVWDEMSIIAECWPKAVIMVDDFKVPGDSEYEYDNYGKDNVLKLSNVPSNVLELFTPLFPSLPAAVETGRKRGCLVLLPKQMAARAERQLAMVRGQLTSSKQGSG